MLKLSRTTNRLSGAWLALGTLAHPRLGRALATLFLALAVSGAGQVSLANAAGSTSIGVWLQAQQVGARRTLCVGDRVTIRLTAWKRVGVEGSLALRRMLGVNIAASVVGSGGVGTISPPSSATSLGSNPAGTAYFTFKAEKPGVAILQFTARVNEATFLGIPVSGNSVRTQALMQVDDCKYRVSATSRWSVPGEANINILARINVAGMSDDGSGSYRGTARVQWIVSVAQVEDCQGTLPPESQAEVVGQVFGPDEFVVDISYDTATVQLEVDCGDAGGSRDIQLTPAAVTVTVPTSGGNETLPQEISGPPVPTGSVTVIVTRATE